MARRRSRVDANQGVIVDALEAMNASVQLLTDVGGGCPDLLVGHKGFICPHCKKWSPVPMNYLMEVKDGDTYPSWRKLTQPQIDWHAEWNGQKIVVLNPTEAIKVLMFPCPP